MRPELCFSPGFGHSPGAKPKERDTGGLETRQRGGSAPTCQELKGSSLKEARQQSPATKHSHFCLARATE